MTEITLIIPAFIAGLLTFIAPCTLPLVPGYLAFISGTSFRDLHGGAEVHAARRRVMRSALFYVLGFSAVFILLGALAGLGGSALIQYRLWLSRIGGVMVILFGLFLLGALKLPFLQVEKHFKLPASLHPGTPRASFLFGATFAFGWTPCVGPVLGSVLLLAGTSATLLQGVLLLTVFSAGLAVPFLLVAAGMNRASAFIARHTRALHILSAIGGLFLIFIGILLLTDSMARWVGFFYQQLNILQYEKILDYL